MKWRLCQTQQRTFYSVHINSVIGHLQFIPIQIGSVTVFHSVIGQFTSFHTALPLVGSTTHQSLDAALLIYWLRRSLITVRVNLKRHHHCLASECKQATPLTQYLAILTGDKLQIAEANMSPKNEVEDMTNRHQQFALSSMTEMIWGRGGRRGGWGEGDYMCRCLKEHRNQEWFTTGRNRKCICRACQGGEDISQSLQR